MVFGVVKSSNLIEYPTSCPSLTFISSETRFATLVAATLLGCVHATFYPRFASPHSTRYYGIWVVLPEPVSPITTNILLSIIAALSSSLNMYIGRDSLCYWIASVDLNYLEVRKLLLLSFGVIWKRFLFSLLFLYMFLITCTISLVAFDELGSFWTLSKSLYWFFWTVDFWSLISFRSFACYTYYIAALYKEPSGFFVI